MTVDELRDTLTRLVDLLRATDAKAGTLRDLTEFVEGTASFGEMPLKAFVKLAEAGKSPTAPRPARGRGTATNGPSPEMLVKAVTDLYAGATGSDVTDEHVQKTADALLPLTKRDVLRAAEAVRLAGMKSKSKENIVAAIRNVILDRRRAALRTQLSQPTPTAGEG